MSESNGNGNGRVNPLSKIFRDDLVRIEIKDPDDEPTGVVAVFKPCAPQTKARYDHIVQTGLGGRKPKYDEANAFVFPLIIDHIEGLLPEDCRGMEPIAFCQKDPQGVQLMKVFMNAYWNRTLPTAEDSAKK